MPTCEKCERKFGNRELINGKIRHLQNRRYCIICSPYGGRNTRNLVHMEKVKKLTLNNEKLCPRCNRVLKIDQFYKRRRALGDPTSYCRECLKVQAVERFRKIKREAVDYKGGKCVSCGYSKNMRNLHFHHLDKSKKDFTISQVHCKSLERIKSELDKCILVCSNCHGEIEDGMIQVDPNWHPR